MIAQHIRGVFGELLKNLDHLAPSDTINTDPQDYDDALEDDPAFAFLTDDALPEDPSKAAIVGIIDDAIPFAHERLRIGAASRVASIWFQDVPPDPTVPVGADLPLGREFRGAQISDLVRKLDTGELVDEDALYHAAKVVDFRRESPQRLAFAAGHGASIAGLAAGFLPGEHETARKLPIIAVSLPPYVVRDTLGMAAPFYMMLAILHIIHRARRLCRYIERRQNRAAGSVRLPLVINLSFGLTAGAKDGSSDLERFMDAISVKSKTDLGPVRFVIAIGNHRVARVRARIEANSAEVLDWQVRPDDKTPSFMEIWGPARPGTTQPSTPVQIECTPPGHSTPLKTAFTEYGTYQKLVHNGHEVARAYLQHRVFAGHGRELVTLVVPPTRPEQLETNYGIPGRWGVRVLAPFSGDFDVYIQRDDSVPGFGVKRGRQSRLVDETDPVFGQDGRVVVRDPAGKTHGVLRAGSINAFACGLHPIRVGGVFDRTGATVPYSSLALDDTSDVAEGDVLAAAATSEVWRAVPVMGTHSGSRSYMSGTSLAAALVSRELALAFADGTASGVNRPTLVSLLQQRVADAKAHTV